MKKSFRIIALILLLINAIGALYGGWEFIRDPIDGGTMHMPPENLGQTPFKDYLIPGIILFLFNGVMCLIIFFLTLFKNKRYPILVVFQGVVLITWIGVQVAMLQSFHALHGIFGGIGLALIVLGLLLWKRGNNL